VRSVVALDAGGIQTEEVFWYLHVSLPRKPVRNLPS
jgi:hypothetical protein